MASIFESLKFSIVSFRELNELRNKVKSLESDIDNAIKFAHRKEKANGDEAYSNAKNETKLEKALTDMYAKMSEVMIRDEQRNWIAQGLASFTTLTQSRSNLDDVSSEMLPYVIKYVKASQGALFIANEEDPSNPFLEMKALYAYNRKEFLNKRIDVKEGLVGQCFQKGETICLTDLPVNFVKINSGLGSANPASLVLVTLKNNDSKVGVLEVAFLKQPEPIQIEFLKRVAENISATIASLRTTSHIQNLLKESQAMADQLLIKEKELESKNKEMERVKEADRELMEHKLETQRVIYEKTFSRLREKMRELQTEPT